MRVHEIVARRGERDVELARQVAQRFRADTVVRDEGVDRAGKGARVGEFVWVDARDRRPSHLAHVVEAGLERGEVDGFKSVDDSTRIVQSQAAELDCGARCDVGAAVGAHRLDGVRQHPQLCTRQLPIRHPHPHHELAGRALAAVEEADPL